MDGFKEETVHILWKFKPDMPAKEDLEQVVETVLYAVNGMGKQATITTAVRSKELRDHISAVNTKIGGWKERFELSEFQALLKEIGVDGEWEGIGA